MQSVKLCLPKHKVSITLRQMSVCVCASEFSAALQQGKASMFGMSGKWKTKTYIVCDYLSFEFLLPEDPKVNRRIDSTSDFNPD